MKAKQLLQTMLLIKTVGVFSLLHIQASAYRIQKDITQLSTFHYISQRSSDCLAI